MLAPRIVNDVSCVTRIILVLANVFFYSNSHYKSIEQLIFSAFGKILVLVNAFFYSNSNYKVMKNRFLQLLARSWFW